MRPERLNRGVFLATNDRLFFATRSEGGVWQDSGSRCGNATFLYLTNSIVVILYYPTPRVPNRRKRRGRERPPQKVGGHVTLDSGAEWHASIRPHAGRSRPHLSLREGSETGQIGAPKALVRVSPFPSPWMIPDRSSPSRVRFAASRPGLLRADPKGWLFMRGKGGGGPCGRSEREPFGHTSRLEP